MDNKKLGVLLGAFIFIVVALALIQPLSNSVKDTSTTRSDNTTFTLTGLVTVIGNPDVRNAGNIQTDTIIVNNGTNITFGSNNWNAYTNGSIIFKTATITSNSGVNISFNYLSANYVKDATSRTLIDLIILFFAIGTLVIFIGYVLKDSDLFSFE